MAPAMTITGRAVAFRLTARPAMMFVACPVSEAAAIFLTGGQSVPVKYSVIATSAIVTPMPMTAHQK